jgi:hypothetical protein
MAPIRAELEAMRAASELAAEMLPPGVVAISPDGPDAGAWGGVSIARTVAGHAGPTAPDADVSGGNAADEGIEEVVARQATA